MNSSTDTATLTPHYGEGSDRLREEVTPALEKVFAPILLSGSRNGTFPPERATAEDPERVADKLAWILVNNSRTAALGPPNAETLVRLQTRLVEFVQRGMAIEGQMLWSPKKHWMSGSENAVDLAELLAIQTLVSIDSAVRRVYPAGMSFVIDFEDIEFQFMEGRSDEVMNAQHIYIFGMKRLVAALGLDDVFTLRRMSDRAKTGEELSEWRRQMNENYRALEAYWFESERCSVSAWQSLASFKQICRLGWKGMIPSEMRRYYLDRLGKLNDGSYVGKVDMVLRNLAGILLHHQVGLFIGSDGFSPLKFSFVRAADGAPVELLNSRVDLRFAPRRLCSRVSAAAPWATKGFVSGRGKDVRVAFRGWHELADARPQFTKGWFTIGRRNRTAEVRADFMRESN